MAGNNTRRFLVLLLSAAAVILNCTSCKRSERVWFGYERGQLMIWWAYYPFIEEVVFPERIIAGEEFEIRVRGYLPPDVPEELYYSPSEPVYTADGGLLSDVTVVATDNPSDDTRSARDPWLGVELAPVPSTGVWVFTYPPRGYELEPRTYTLTFLAAASRGDAGLVKTARNRGSGWLPRDEYDEWMCFAMGDGKLKLYDYEITVHPAEDGGAAE